MDCPSCHSALAEGAADCIRCGPLTGASAHTMTPEAGAIAARAGDDTPRARTGTGTGTGEVETADPFVGKLLAGRYQLLESVGRGGMGAVYRAEHVLMKKEVAVKVLHQELGSIEEVARRFEREAQSASRLDHPNIITVTDFGRTDEGVLFLVMELLSGELLAQEIDRGPIPESRAIKIMLEVLRALEHAHGQGVIHRDLKPENVFITRREGEEVVKLLDFGIARMAEGGTGESLTQAGVVFGTPEYLSPEQAVGEVVDGRADLYAAGVMLYEMIVGERPFTSTSRVALLSMHLTAPVPRLRDRCPDATPAVERAVLRALEKQRDQRYPTATAFREDLERVAPVSRKFTVTIALPERDFWVKLARRTSTAMQVLRPSAISARWRQAEAAGREAGLRHPRAVLGGAAGGVVVLLLLAGISLARVGRSPRLAASVAPPPRATAGDLARAEQLLAQADLASARVVLQHQLSAHPDQARVHYLLGNLNYAEKQRSQALGNYRSALHLDAAYRNDPALLANLRALLDDETLDDDTFMLLVRDVGTAALPLLEECARTCRQAHVRRAAGEALPSLGGTAPPPSATPIVDPAERERLLLVLEKGKGCKERRTAVAPLRALGDATLIEPLVRARDRRGGFFDAEKINSCMTKELNEAIKALGGGG